ncbi:MAG: S66 peptidase family protein [Longimicrobiales bacterium]
MNTHSTSTAPCRPARLFEGARVALVAPAGPVSDERVAAAVTHCHEFGLVPVVQPNARARLGYLAGSDDERASDLQHAIDNPDIDAIWAMRGGYGSLRILPRLDWSGLIGRPRPYIGFSDNTAVHLALAAMRVISFHAPHPGSAFPPFTRASFQAMLFDGATGPLLPPDGCTPTSLIPGDASGRLAGGNLALLAASAGTPYALRADGCIVILEDVGEATYRVDRALTQLILSGALTGATGFAIGQFTERPAAANDRPLDEIFTELLGPIGAPVLSGLPFGHVDDQWSLPIGALARIDGETRSLELLEPGVS